MKWINGTINVLGVEVGGKEADLISLNYSPVFSKMQSILSNWSRRNISLLGKIQIINSLIVSLFVYKMYVLPKISTNFIEKYNKLIEHFLWNGRKPKIPLKILQNASKWGGANLVDLSKKDDSIKISWVKAISKDAYLRRLAFAQLQPTLQEDIFKCNLNEQDIEKEFKPGFWRDVLLAWSRVAFTKDIDILNQADILRQVIWYNSAIRIGNKPVFYKNAYEKGLTTLYDLLDDQLNLMSNINLCNKYGLTTMQLNSVINALPKHWKRVLFKEKTVSFPGINPYSELLEKSKIVKHAYQLISSNNTAMFPTYVKWQAKLYTEMSFQDFINLFARIRATTNYVKLRSFQYRMLCNAIITNVHLAKWKIISSELCCFCDEAPETMLHLFYECNIIKRIWQEVAKFSENLVKTGDPFIINAENIMFNRTHKDAFHVFNFITLAVKSKIYTQRCFKERNKSCHMYCLY